MNLRTRLIFGTKVPSHSNNPPLAWLLISVLVAALALSALIFVTPIIKFGLAESATRTASTVATVTPRHSPAASDVNHVAR